ncbi:pyruvate, phosphate dikinase [Candidatus Bathyarchaeota archaeon]|nr:pyruvate, phosphate dikinase [Candidatus Bathyarchaeota archaeon]
MEKWIYSFEEGSKEMRDLLGGKGANLAEMTRLGIRVPPGFTITTRVCKAFFEAGGEFPEGLWEQILEHMHRLEEKTGKKFGDPENPLLVSVRSGAPVSMPGMMDTILNLGLNDEVVEGLARLTGDRRFALDAYRRLITMFADVVMHADRQKFEEVLEDVKRKRGVKRDADLDAEALEEVVRRQKEVFKKEVGREFPQSPLEQLRLAVAAVFNSWNNPRAIAYRKIAGIPDDMGTACNIQTMVFGNRDWNSGSGVLFTRNPANGEPGLYGELLFNAQGEDVVAGIRTPISVEDLKEINPGLYKELEEVARKLEAHYRDMQDIEFTVESGTLYILQTRTGKRTTRAAVKIAVDMVKEGLIDEREAILRIDPNQIERLLHKTVDPRAEKKVIAKGLPASPGAAVGRVVFDPMEAEEWADKGEKVILVRPETTPEDIRGMAAAEGILTSRGGMTSHAAIVARGIGKPAVVGCEELHIDLEKEFFTARGVTVRKGETITIDGLAGEVMVGEVPLVEPEISGEFEEMLTWADKYRRLGVWANANDENDAKKALEYGAEGIGLARTERMFLGVERVALVRKMVMADTAEERRKVLEELLPMQKEDFKKILRVMDGKPVQIRLLDPPLHEFMPKVEEILERIYEMEKRGADPKEIEEEKKILAKVRKITEANPMIGLRMCRLGIVYPEIYETQARAIFEAASELKKEGFDPRPEIMIPGSIVWTELAFLKKLIEKARKEVAEKYGFEIPYRYGTMIEIPRAALTADEIAKFVDFFSFGTNDLTQTGLGLSRDDAQGTFLPIYLDKHILEKDPFQTLDVKGVGKLVEIGVKLGRKANPNLKIGICGEHGGDPDSIYFFHKVGLDYVSCSPFRIPVARLAAAVAALREEASG